MTTHKRRLLQTIKEVMVAISHKACTRTHILNNPIGEKAKRVSKRVISSFPILYAIHCQLLAILSFVDDQILAVEYVTETLFPPSTYVFNKIDRLLRSAELLPGKFDNLVDKISHKVMTMHQVPFLDWFFDAKKGKEEEEIVIDISCNEYHIASPSSVGSENADKSLTKSNSLKGEDDAFCKENVSFDQAPTATGPPELCSFQGFKALAFERFKAVGKCSYKEVLQKGTKENVVEDQVEKKDNIGISEKFNFEHFQSDDPILDLFETSWHMSPRAISKP